MKIEIVLVFGGIHHILSRRYTDKYQDKGGCSRNGVIELLMEVGMISISSRSPLKTRIILECDRRGVPTHLWWPSSHQGCPENKMNELLK